MKKSLRLVFLNDQGGKQSITIPEVKDDITSVEIKSLTQAILSSNIFGDELRSLVKAVEAALTSKGVSVIKL
ncbi:MAG: DUF2922 domain-containing protein [Clostridium sp.]